MPSVYKRALLLASSLKEATRKQRQALNEHLAAIGQPKTHRLRNGTKPTTERGLERDLQAFDCALVLEGSTNGLGADVNGLVMPMNIAAKRIEMPVWMFSREGVIRIFTRGKGARRHSA
jgi:hypothetical protein